MRRDCAGLDLGKHKNTEERMNNTAGARGEKRPERECISHLPQYTKKYRQRQVIERTTWSQGAAGFGVYPEQVSTGRRGYFGKFGSDWES
jgi:hypothetical protein